MSRVNEVDCIFCKIVSGDIPCFRIWEDDSHLAFLTPFPNTPGFTVLVTKDHHGSYFAELPAEVLVALTATAQKLAKLLDSKFDDVGRTGLIFEGFGVNHIHAKLVPTHGTKGEAWKKRAIARDTYFSQYPGYISSHDGPPAKPEDLEALSKRLRS